MINFLKFLCLIVIFYLSQTVYTHASDREIALKARLIFNFSVYSKGDWFDPIKKNNYLICSPDIEFVEVAHQTLKNKKVRNSLVLVKHIPIDSNLLHHCHSIFFSANTLKNINTTPFSATFSGVMLIGESNGFIEQGGHINFFLAGGKARFEIDPVGLLNNNIEVSSKVIRLGKVFKRGANDK